MMSDVNDVNRLRVEVRPRARRIAVRIDTARREAVLVTPSASSRRRALAFAEDRREWIAARLSALPPAQPFREGGAIPIHGAAHVLVRPSLRGAAWLEDDPRRFAVPAPPDRFASRVARALKQRATETLTAHVERAAQALGRRPSRVTVKDTRSRWGSCASSGAIALSWRLVCAPDHVAAYVAAHEVAHLAEPHHGPAFWRLVEQLYGDYEPARAWLRANAAHLFAVGADA